MIQVLVADDHAVVREGLKRILEETKDIVVAGEAGTGEEVLEKLQTPGPWDAVLLDITLPDLSGLEVLRRIRQAHRDLPVLILSVHSEDQYALRVLKAGASGYLSKESAPDQLIEAIRRIASGGRFLTPLVVEKLVSGLGEESGEASHDKLSDREYQVLRLIAGGLSPRDIAEQLSVSPRTVGTYRARILKKMGLKGSAEIIQYAAKENLL